MSFPLRKAVSLLTAATALALGVTVLAAPSAFAVGSSACTTNFKDLTTTITADPGKTMRTGPGNNYEKKKFLPIGTKVTIYCMAKPKGTYWYYIKSGKTKGWVLGW
ncbi:SH3 domain-containing protein [Streptomyces sp. ISL-94]|uniref:SH3 domain-containing protein n=1 Tax=Streptomyces sp. ISL-94 TaxID=2819190 RepID=UPI001BE8F5AC|nr:SH3 domain-containing protein [Streptomyces sp. ISL-94]MBT2478052.1 SH3 domain-containing protein [Streptomyces sp. ISL-94]